MILRPLKPENAELLIEREQRSSQYPWSLESLRQSVDAGDDCKIVSVEENDVGYFVLRHLSGVSEILNLVIFKSCQKKGYGKKLMQLILREVEYQHSEEIWLEVRESNLSALRLYTSAGFIKQNTRKNYYPVKTGANKNKKEDAVLMTRVLESQA